jgi:hypothetical protein
MLIDVLHYLSTLTCRRFSKSRAAIFFISETFAEKRLMVSLPKEDTCLKLRQMLCRVSYAIYDMGIRTGGLIRRSCSCLLPPVSGEGG